MRTVRLTESDMVRLVKRIIREQNSSNENNELTQEYFEKLIDDLIDEVIEDDFFGSGPSDEDEENQLRNSVVYRAQEKLEMQYPGIEVDSIQYMSRRSSGTEYYIKEDEENGIPYLSYKREN